MKAAARALYRLAVSAWHRIFRHRRGRHRNLTRHKGRTDHRGLIEGAGRFELRTPPADDPPPPSNPEHAAEVARMREEILERFHRGESFKTWAPLMKRGVTVAARIARREEDETAHVVLLFPCDGRREP